MDDIEFLLALLLAVALLAQLAGRLRVPYPVFLVVAGIAIGLIPGGPDITLEPDVVFLVFLPPLLYAAGFRASPRDLRAEAGRITLLAVVLVFLTMGAVALVAHALFGDLGWAMAFVLGAVLAPTDPVAATSVFRGADVPDRVATVVEGEALVNDGVGLTVYRVAVGAATSGTFALGSAALQLIGVAAGGVVVGLAVGWLLGLVRRRMQEPEIETALSLFTPYAAYIVAEHLTVSGILAAVTVGVYTGWRSQELVMPETRLKMLAFWGVLAFLLDSVLFVLVGLQLPVVAGALAPTAPAEVLLPALGVAATVIGVRMAFEFVVARARACVPRVAEPLPLGEQLVVGWSGMRGAVSLAAALAIPALTEAGRPLAGRELVILVTFVTILATIILQGLTLPLLVRATGLRRGAEAEEQEQRARLAAAQAALERLDRAAGEDGVPGTTVERLRTVYREHAERAAAELDEEDVETEDSSAAYRELRGLTLQAERETVLRLRAEGRLSTETARKLEHEIDLAQSRVEA